MTATQPQLVELDGPPAALPFRPSSLPLEPAGPAVQLALTLPTAYRRPDGTTQLSLADALEDGAAGLEVPAALELAPAPAPDRWGCRRRPSLMVECPDCHAPAGTPCRPPAPRAPFEVVALVYVTP